MIKISFRLKLIVIFVFFSLIISLGALYVSYQKFIRFQKEDLRSSLLMTATLGANLIDGDEHQSIGPERSSLNSTAYQHIKRQLTRIRNANPRIRYVYTIVKGAGQNRLFFMVDSAQSEDLFSYPGDSYESLTEDIVLSAFQRPQVNEDLIRDTWGSYMSGFAPIFDSKGNAVAVLGLDMSGEMIEKIFQASKYNSIMIFIVCVFISILLGIIVSRGLTKPIDELVAGTQRISAGDLKYTVDIKTKDEMGKLADSFNRMSESLRESNKKLRTNFLNAIRALTVALEAKDPYTKGHSERVTEYGLSIAKEMGIPEEELENLKYLYIMHDIGKIGIRETILNKPGLLSEDERKIISEHPEIGEDILAPIGGFLNEQLTQIVRSHHERPDGKGYPEGLTEDEIPLYVKILTVADAFDAMVSDRPYRKAHTIEYAINELRNNSGTQFSKHVVEALVRVIERGKKGDFREEKD